MTPEIHGFVKPGFEPVQAAFEKNFAEGLEQGACATVTRDGELVVDLWGGHADAARTRPWERDTIVNVFSTTKAMAAVSLNLLIDRGQVDPDASVATYWPEFAAAGKATITPRHLLTHQAGLHPIRPLVSLRRIRTRCQPRLQSVPSVRCVAMLTRGLPLTRCPPGLSRETGAMRPQSSIAPTPSPGSSRNNCWPRAFPTGFTAACGFSSALKSRMPLPTCG